MKHLPISLLILTTTLAGGSAYAQTEPSAAKTAARDSMRQIQMEQAALRVPTLRQINISTDIIGKGNMVTNLDGNPIFKGKAATVRTSILFNIPIATWGKNSFTTSVSYFQQHLQMTELQSLSPLLNNDDRISNKSTVGFSAAYQHMGSVFGKTVMLSASVMGVTNDARSIKKISYLGTAIFPIKQTQTTRYSAGIILNIDPSLKVPVVPIFTYWHRFQNEMELNVTLPSQVALRKNISPKLSASLGTSLSGSLAFFSLNSPNLPQDANYTTIDLKSGLGVEYRISRKILLGVNGGLLTPLSARAFDSNKTSSEYFLNNKLSNVPYINFSFSVLPFFFPK